MAVQVGSVENFGLYNDVNWNYVNDFVFFSPGWKEARNLQTFHRVQGFSKGTGKRQLRIVGQAMLSTNTQRLSFYLFPFPKEQG